MQFPKIKVNPLTGLKKQITYVFKPGLSFKDKVAYICSSSSTRSTLPFEKMKGTNFSIEYGLRLKPRSQGWFNSRVVMLSSFLTTLPLLWWLSNSDASISPEPKNSHFFHAPLATVSQADKNELASSSSMLEENNFLSPTLAPKRASLPWLHLTIESGDTLSRIFQKHQLNQTQLYQIVRMSKYANQFRQLQINQELHIKHDFHGNIQNLILTLKNKTDELHIYKEDEEFEGEIRRIGRHTETVVIHGKVETSLSVAAQQVGLSDNLLAELIQIFHWDIDFDRQVQSGDEFTVIYKQHLFEGDVEQGDILAAEFINQGQVHRALRYLDKTGLTNYYTPEGNSLNKISLLIAPVNFTRISSYFGDRKHPVLNRYHFHTGVDYAARWSTPIVAAGDATVKFAGRKGGYGKTMVLKHHKRVRTLYAHLLKFAKDIKVGDKVVQGQIIGYVGASGRATGPHLHYEIKIDGEHQDPLQVDSPISLPLVKSRHAHFFRKTQKLVTQLDAFSQSTPTKVVLNIRPKLAPTAAKSTQPTAAAESVLKQHSMNFTTTGQPLAIATKELHPK